MKRCLLLLSVVVAILSLSFSGIVLADSPLQGSKDDVYYMVTFVSGIEYWKPAFAGMKEAADNLGVTAEYTGANQYDINQQVTVLEQVIAKKPAGILLTCSPY